MGSYTEWRKQTTPEPWENTCVQPQEVSSQEARG